MDPKEVMSRLKFIGKIQAGDKINTKFMYIQSNSIFTRISRSVIYQDNRTNTLALLKDTIDSSFKLLAGYRTTDEVKRMIVHNDLVKSKNGLNHIKETYQSDLKFVCDVEILLQDIDILTAPPDVAEAKDG